jgi:hypothetical protein
MLGDLLNAFLAVAVPAYIVWLAVDYIAALWRSMTR